MRIFSRITRRFCSVGMQLPRQFKELVAGSPSQRNWRGIGIALLVICSICALITLAVVLLTPGDKDGRFSGTKLNLSDISVNRVIPDDPNPEWLSNKVVVYRDENSTLWKIDVTEVESSGNFSRQKLVGGEIIKDNNAYSTSPDAKYLAFLNVRRKEFRHSSLLRVTVNTVLPNASIDNHKSINEDEPVKIFEWAPNSLPPACAFVDSKNDIWYQSDAFDPSTKIQVTNTGSDNVYNGVSDWLYEEEIFETDSALFFSKSGAKLAFSVINDTLVKKANLEMYTSSNYPRTMSIPYPKVGEVLPAVALSVYDVSSKKLIGLKPPREVEALNEFYLIHATWTVGKTDEGSETLVAVWANRVQNVSYLSSCLVPGRPKETILYCKLDHKQEYENHWMNPTSSHVEVTTANRYFTLLPRKQSDGYFYLHAAFINYNANSQNVPKFVTSGLWEVAKIVGYSEVEQILYFTAVYPNSWSRHLMRIRLSAEQPESVECLSCHLTGIGCNFVSAEMSPNNPTLYVLKCEGPGVPKSYLRSLVDNSTLATVTNNTKYALYISQKLLPVVQYETIPLHDGYTATVKLLLPPGKDHMAIGDRFPLILRVYAGPGSQFVTDRWSVSFDSYMAASRNFIVAYVDGRGSSGRGSRYTSAIYRNLGTVEIEDQITVTRLLLNSTNHLIRRNAVSVWGWSYGGFVSAHIVKRDMANTFKCAASVAPVTNFLFYDAAYTERFMGLNSTADNYDGYQKTIVYSNVSGFAQSKYLLAHGTGDDNVHFQNSAMLVDALTKINVQFQYMAYTNQQHSIGERHLHLNTMLDNFFMACAHNSKPGEDMMYV